MRAEEDESVIDTDTPETFATYCPDCEAMFMDGEEGHGNDECFECGEGNCYEVPA